jgi:acetyl-CoA carboxylase carboxyl transferase subunit alpha
MASFYQLDFEKPLAELDERIAAAERSAPPAEIPALGGLEDDRAAGDRDAERGRGADSPAVVALRREREQLLSRLYSNLSPWNTVRVARHPDRPQTRDYIKRMCRDFCELHGDRRFGDDPAIVTGFGRIGSRKVLIVGHQKGRSTQEKLGCHFGCAHPEGYRKALAKMELAAKFGVPIVTFVDTPGAYPGLGAEERGQAEAIAVNMREMSRLPVPIVSVIIGEGGSGGALGIAVADRVGMLRNSWYSVISPEGCAAILWKQANEQTNTAAAEALRLTARDNLALGIVDAVIEEPLGGAHRDADGAARMLEQWVAHQLDELAGVEPGALMDARYARFRRLGAFDEVGEDPTPSRAQPQAAM